MRALATTLASQLLLAAAISTAASPVGATDHRQRSTVQRVAFHQPDVRAMIRGARTPAKARQELRLNRHEIRARLFRDAGVIGDFTGSRLGFGLAIRSPYLARLGVGDGLSTRFQSGPYTFSGAMLSGPTGDSVATELTAFGGRMALQAGHKETVEGDGSMSFGGAHVDFDALNAQFSVRWHVGFERTEHDVNQSSAGSVAVALPSLLDDGDRLGFAVSRPVRLDFAWEEPILNFGYSVPVSLGRLTCSGAVETGGAQASRGRVSWGMRW